MKKDDKIYVAGHTGMVGGAIARSLKDRGYTQVVLRTRRELDLTNRADVDAFFAGADIDYVFLAAAMVGGIMANETKGGDFLRENLYIQTNVIDAAYRGGVRKLMFLGSSCIYPKHATQPISEDSLLTGPLEPTNLPYAVAKIAGKAMCDAYRKQYGFDAVTIMPCNIYGVGDNFHPEDSHVAAGLMRRFHEAKLAGKTEITAWGSGAPLREFLYVDDLADACLHVMDNAADIDMINAGSGEEISIKDLADLVAQTVGYHGRITWDSSKPDGAPRKVMDSGKIRALGWTPKTGLRDGLEKMYAFYRQTETKQ
ncbi:GDP-L-fucose synthase family protein [Hyphococcus sp.]|uniref:GDP-L-fucose synthase family protein n=1 Tax=Hyphococcus sp. TaxID=2038636 RepID=UPI003CCB8F2B